MITSTAQDTTHSSNQLIHKPKLQTEILTYNSRERRGRGSRGRGREIRRRGRAPWVESIIRGARERVVGREAPAAEAVREGRGRRRVALRRARGVEHRRRGD